MVEAARVAAEVVAAVEAIITAPVEAPVIPPIITAPVETPVVPAVITAPVETPVVPVIIATLETPVVPAIIAPVETPAVPMIVPPVEMAVIAAIEAVVIAVNLSAVAMAPVGAVLVAMIVPVVVLLAAMVSCRYSGIAVPGHRDRARQQGNKECADSYAFHKASSNSALAACRTGVASEQAAKVAPFAAGNEAHVRKSAAGDFSNELVKWNALLHCTPEPFLNKLAFRARSERRFSSPGEPSELSGGFMRSGPLLDFQRGAMFDPS